MADPGEAVGFSAVVSGRAYGATAEMMASGQVDLIPRDSLLVLMKEDHEIALAVAEQLSASCYSLHDTLRSLGLAAHPMERLAKHDSYPTVLAATLKPYRQSNSLEPQINVCR